MRRDGAASAQFDGRCGQPLRPDRAGFVGAPLFEQFVRDPVEGLLQGGCNPDPILMLVTAHNPPTSGAMSNTERAGHPTARSAAVTPHGSNATLYCNKGFV